MTVAEVLTIIKDCVVIVTAAIASWVGIRGLSTWRRQLSGNVEYQLAKNILTAVFELRDAIDSVRNPLMLYAQEPDLPAEELANLSRPEREWRAFAQAYQKRWEPIPPAKARLDANLWEAEAVWGRTITVNVGKFGAKLNELHWAIRWHLEDKNPATAEDPRDADHAMLVKRRNLLYAHGQDDQFKKEVDAIVSDIENDLRPHVLGRHHP